MSRFAPVDDQYDPKTVEDRVFEYWDAVDAYEQTKRHREGGEPFYFLDGPPYTSGSAHMGTTWNKILKDVYIRYHRMQGYDVTDRPGYDMHGLPIETRVEEALGFENKRDIEAFGEENFIEECKSFAEEQLEGLQSDFRSFGVWMDWDDPYKTVRPEYMEAAWWGFARAYERDLVEQGKRSIAQCPRCETAIAKNEVEFDDVEDPSIYVTFPLVDREGSLVIWTTTPWTIPANSFVAVDADGDYVRVRAETDGSEDLLYIGKPKVEEVLAAGRYDDYEIEEELSGSELIGWSYEHPFADRIDHPGGEGAFEVYDAEYVELDGDGTGLVHSAPGHGEEDFRRGSELGLEIFCPVGPDGLFDDRVGSYTDEFVRDANETIITDLDDRGLLLARETIEHSYGHCWRCDTGIVQIVTDQWFITVTDVKDELLSNIQDSEWYPPEARDERFRDFVEESPDWNVSRQRYWGIPIPIWLPTETTDGEPIEWNGDMDEAIVVADRDELADRVDQEIDPKTVDLHKDTVDDLTITDDGVVYERVADVFDVWLDSSVASWGSLNYPESVEAFEELWPADLIIEAHDQTRGWFWSQLGMGSTALGEIPYETVLMHGHALMPDGRAMSKSKDILIDPQEVISAHGVDPMRAFLLSVTPQGDDMNFSWDGVETMQRNINILWNVFRFPLPYMRLDDFDPEAITVEDVELETVDRWILSRLQTVIDEMQAHFAEFRQDRAFTALLSFIVEDVSRFYIQVVRERMWAEEASESKLAAYATLYRVLLDSSKLLAPFVPFVAEEIYGTLVGDDRHETVHMNDWPTYDERLHDPSLESDVEIVAAVEDAGSNARQQAERKLRWPVQRVVVAADDDEASEAVDAYRGLLRDRLNAREIELVEPGVDWEELSYSVRADMSVLGPAFGEEAGEVMNALNAVSLGEASVEALEAAVADELGQSVELEDEMVSFNTETPAGVEGTAFSVNGDDRGIVYVDTTITEDIESEGYAREVIRRIQEMRKELDLDLEAEIRVELAVADERISGLIHEHKDLIAEEVRAASIDGVDDATHRKEWDIEGIDVKIGIAPVTGADID